MCKQKQHKIISTKIVWAVLMVICISVLIYAWNFRPLFVLSSSKEEWAFFGDYLSGVFAVFNVFIFVLFGLYIRNLDIERAEFSENQENIRIENQRKLDAERANQDRLLEERRSLAQINTQKMIIKAQFQYDMLKELENRLHKVTEEMTKPFHDNCIICIMFIETFMKRGELFPIVTDNNFVQQSLDLRISLKALSQFDPTKDVGTSARAALNDFMNKRSDFIAKIQQYILHQMQ